MEEQVLELLESLHAKVDCIQSQMGECTIPAQEWFSVEQVAKELGKSPFTVRERWCNGRRIVAEKDVHSGRWKIPRDEFIRLKNGGGLLPIAG